MNIFTLVKFKWGPKFATMAAASVVGTALELLVRIPLSTWLANLLNLAPMKCKYLLMIIDRFLKLVVT